ncbi:MAG: YggS family pyridoxal phosphate-dependent enzyme [Deltaproteobacteria bacterium]|nr:YggS family pyridoxal phosphate-dependent enzyme [Deltaproteobacteria bacterium]
MTDIAKNIKTIKKQMELAAMECGRNPSEINLVAVSKRHSVDSIRTAYEAGQIDFGENYAQELRDKNTELPRDIHWHYIGPLQENKLKYIVGNAVLIHTVSTEKILHRINSMAEKLGIVQNILLQVKTSEEESKHGCSSEEAWSLVKQLEHTPHVKCLGFMTMPPFFEDPENTVPYFRRLRKLLDSMLELNIPNFHPIHLSMGMTGDFHQAIREGATLVRIGTAIFGERIPLS